MTTALGPGRNNNWQKLLDGKSGLRPCDFYDIKDLPTWIGRVEEVDAVHLPESLKSYDCRNNQLALLALEQDGFIDSVNAAIAEFGRDQIGVFMGTSTSGIHQTELAYIETPNQSPHLPDWYNYQTTHNIFSIADFVAKALGLTGIASSISTACSSSTKVFASAHRAIELGLCKAAIVGGVDTLCLTTLYGFNSLQLVSDEICKPFDANRKGLSIGEAAGFALISQEPDSSIQVKGYGESSDAHHMSSPHPEGQGAIEAMAAAMQRSGLKTSDIDYINMHGTGTPANDLAESKAVCSFFGTTTEASSTKGWTGHTLGAAGIIEAGFCMLSLEHQHTIANLNLIDQDPNVHALIIKHGQKKTIRNLLTNSFGFGGSNSSLVIGAGE